MVQPEKLRQLQRRPGGHRSLRPAPGGAGIAGGHQHDPHGALGALDGGKRLLLASNYDGTWENYIDEFAEMILSGLDATLG